MTALFIATTYSPWSERARWALDHAGVDYREIAYVPMLGTPWLRLKIKKLTGRVSVPALVDGETILRESVEIARWAAPALFPPGQLHEIERWVHRADELMNHGRALSVPKVISDPGAQRESLPSFIPAPLRAPLSPMAVMGARYIARKYGLDTYDPIEAERVVRAVLTEVRETLADGRAYLLGDQLTFADVAIAAATLFVKPMRHRKIRMGQAMRAAYTLPEIAEEFADVLAWRDRLYQEERPS